MLASTCSPAHALRFAGSLAMRSANSASQVAWSGPTPWTRRIIVSPGELPPPDDLALLWARMDEPEALRERSEARDALRRGPLRERLVLEVELRADGRLISVPRDEAL